jgi:NAD+ diphosphatase
VHIFDPFELTGLKPNHLGFGGLDRAAPAREQENLLEEILRHPGTLIVPIWRNLNLFSETGGKDSRPIPAFISADQSSTLIDIAENFVYLGKRNVSGNTIAYLAIDISVLDEEQSAIQLAAWGQFADLRNISPLIDGVDGSILAYARAMLYWHSRNGFCGVCGAQTKASKCGHQRDCTNKECASPHFPRTDSAVIVLIHDQDRVLLGRQHFWPEGMYSLLAGYVEPGETIEHAVAREVFEESGIIVKNIKYQHSQPWPFPASLMLGFTAEASTKIINHNGDEIEDVQWFTKDELLNFGTQEKSLPRELSVSRRLINDWLSSGR